MKHSMRLFAVFLILMLLCSCQNPETSDSEETSVSKESSQKPSVDRVEEPIESVKSSKPAGDLVEEGVYEITSYLHIEGYAVSGMYLLDDHQLLVTLLDAEKQLRTQLYDIYTGKVLEEKSWNLWYTAYEMFETEEGYRGFSAVDADNETAVVYWNGEWRYVEIPDTIEYVKFYGNGKMVGLTGNKLYRDGSVIKLPEEEAFYEFIDVEPDGTVLLKRYNAETNHNVYYLIDARGRIQEADASNELAMLYNDWYVVEDDHQEYKLYQKENFRSSIVFSLDEEEEILQDVAGDTLLSLTVDNELRMYDIHSGTLKQKFAAGRNLYLASLSADGKGAVAGYEGEVYYYIDTNTGKAETQRSNWPGWLDPNNEVCSMEESMEEKYPVELFTGEDAIYPFEDFAALPLTDTEMIMEALEQINAVLGAFPEGFLEELLSTDISKMRIHITGEIISDPTQGATSNPIAFAYPDYSMETQFIVLDGRDSEKIVQNLAHELMHAIDTCITEKSYYGYAGFWNWNTYQPYDFWYNYSYQDANGQDYSDIRYTSEDGDNETYFIDAYSKTFEIEDRARIFEYLFVAGLEGEPLEEYAGMPLMRKAEYLCEVIRSAFICVNDETVWEKGLA